MLSDFPESVEMLGLQINSQQEEMKSETPLVDDFSVSGADDAQREK